MRKVSVIILGAVLSLNGMFAQNNFDSITICHSSEKKLRHIKAGGYEIDLNNGQLNKFASIDGNVNYIESEKTFVLKDPAKSSYCNIKLTDTGIQISNADSSFLIRGLSSLRPKETSYTGFRNIYCQVGAVMMNMDFNDDKITKVICLFAKKSLIITVTPNAPNYISWIFELEDGPTTGNKLLLAYAIDKPQILTIEDHINKVGVRLFSDKATGFFNNVTELVMIKKGVFASDQTRQLDYGKNGSLKQANAAVNTSCVY